MIHDADKMLESASTTAARPVLDGSGEAVEMQAAPKPVVVAAKGENVPRHKSSAAQDLADLFKAPSDSGPTVGFSEGPSEVRIIREHPEDVAEGEKKESEEEGNGDHSSNLKKVQSKQELGVRGLTEAEEEQFKKDHPATWAAMQNVRNPAATMTDGEHRTLLVRDTTFLNVEDAAEEDEDGEGGDQSDGAKKKEKPKGYGTWDGVFTSCLLNIFGVIMFLRLGWVVGQAGIPLAIAIILLSAFVVLLTTLSMSAIATNGSVKAGGAYYLISRSVGPSIGGAIGILFALGNSVAVSLYVIGFCETLTDNLGDTSLTNDPINDIRVYGLILLAMLLGMALIGVGWVIKTQLFLLALLLSSILVFIIGAFVTVDEDESVLGLGEGLLNANLAPDFQTFEGKDYDFFSVFAVFFPAMTGIMAGANISGDLRNPSEAIPKGTLSAIGVSTITYCIMAVLVGAVVQRVTEVTEDGVTTISLDMGLINDSLIMVKVSVQQELVLAGIYAATFSSALASLVGAPRILQKVAADGLVPQLKFFAKTAANGDPRRAYFATFIVAGGCVCIGELNLIAPLISMFFMMTYAMVNFACLSMSLANAPGWRPKFRYYHWTTAALGTVLCIVCMFLTDVIYALGAGAIGILLYVYISYLDPEVNWGSAMEATREVKAIQDLMALKKHQHHIKNFRPHCLLMTKFVSSQKNQSDLIKFGSTLRHGHGMTIFGHVQHGTLDNLAHLRKYKKNHRDGDFSGYVVEDKLQLKRAAAHELLKDSPWVEFDGFGVGAVPHSALPDNEPGSAAESDVEISQNEKKLSIFAAKGEMITKKEAFLDTVLAPTLREGARILMQASGIGYLRPNTLILGFKNKWRTCPQEECDNYVGTIRDSLRLGMHTVVVRGLEHLDWTQTVQGTIDVWWLLDAGGITVLIAHILSKHHFWKHKGKKAQIRLFVLSANESFTASDQKEVKALLDRYRLDNWEVKAICLSQDVSPESILVYNEVIASPGYQIKDQHPDAQTRTFKNLRIAEKIKEHSRRAKLCILSLPFPRISKKVSTLEYMSWLELLTKDFFVPTIMIRGNGQQVLTDRSE